MNIITIKKKKLLIFSVIIMCVLVVLGYTTSFGMQHYYKLDFSTGLVTATTLNVRSGPGIQYKVIATVKKMNTYEFLQE